MPASRFFSRLFNSGQQQQKNAIKIKQVKSFCGKSGSYEGKWTCYHSKQRRRYTYSDEDDDDNYEYKNGDADNYGPNNNDDDDDDNADAVVLSREGLKNVIAAFFDVANIKVYADKSGSTFSVAATECKPVEILTGLQMISSSRSEKRGPWCVSMTPKSIDFIDSSRVCYPIDGVYTSISSLAGLGPLTKTTAVWNNDTLDTEEYFYKPSIDRASYEIKKTCLPTYVNSLTAADDNTTAVPASSLYKLSRRHHDQQHKSSGFKKCCKLILLAFSIFPIWLLMGLIAMSNSKEWRNWWVVGTKTTPNSSFG